VLSHLITTLLELDIFDVQSLSHHRFIKKVVDANIIITCSLINILEASTLSHLLLSGVAFFVAGCVQVHDASSVGGKLFIVVGSQVDAGFREVAQNAGGLDVIVGFLIHEPVIVKLFVLMHGCSVSGGEALTRVGAWVTHHDAFEIDS
jgi:hypothetical protein